MTGLTGIAADLHTHTLASTHAFSTVMEICAAAAAAGLAAVAVTDHAPALPDAPHEWHFGGDDLPAHCAGVRLLTGAEVNVLDWAGTVDLPAHILAKLDFVIASLHRPCRAPGTRDQHTAAWLAAAGNPLIDCLGHPGQPDFPFDHEAVVLRCRETGTLIEINSHSPVARPGSEENCRALARCCARHGVPVAVNTDAHWAGHVGDVRPALALLAEVGFPEALVVNATRARLAGWLRRRGVTL
jgi:putative hydrolase